MDQTSAEPKNFPARPDKTIDWLNKSRDDWKGKPQMTKAELKVEKLFHSASSVALGYRTDFNNLFFKFLGSFMGNVVGPCSPIQ